MNKECLSMKDESFDKCLKKGFGDKKKIAKIFETIKQLEQAENEHFSTHGTDRTKLNRFGKTLSKMGQKDIYCLEIGTDRVLAHVIEDDKAKIFVWFWGGSHEAYNNMLKNLSNNKSLNISDEEKTKIGTMNIVKDIRSKASTPQSEDQHHNRKKYY